MQKLKVSTPQTTDGNTLEYDDNDRVKLRTSLVPVNSKKHFEELNATLPKHLQHKLQIVEVDEAGKEVVAKAEKPTKAEKDKA